MRRFSLALAAVAALSTAALSAQQMTTIHPGKGGSPHVKSAWTAHGAQIAIEYGRPYLKGRPESTLMPAGQPWRTGADEATTITTDKTLKFGTLTLPPGTLHHQHAARRDGVGADYRKAQQARSVGHSVRPVARDGPGPDETGQGGSAG